MSVGAHSREIQSVLAFIENEPAAGKLCRDIDRIFRVSNWLLDPVCLQKFIQLVGEAEFWMLVKERGVELERIIESDEKSPDFKLKSDAAVAPRFEVKTLSVKGGDINIAGMSESSFEAQLSLSQQISEGKCFATAITEAAPHGHITDGKNTTAIIRNLIDKTCNNLKTGQYTDGPTCLVLNLMLIDGYYDGSTNLRPIVFGWPDGWSVRSGAYWNLAFGQTEHLVFGLSEFEGKPGIEGKLERQGVLAANKDIAAMLLVVHPSGESPLIYGLMREADEDSWQEEKRELAEAFFKLVEKNWNDDLDTNGWCLFNLTNGGQS
ncbi:hypothetical protein CNO08_05100 [Lysobacter capsici]|nr:hypothetical protein CNO08_05100 [Lysobacter capsici]